MAERDQLEVLEELLAWTKFANNRALADMLRKVLDDSAAYTIFELSDGTRTQSQVAQEAKVSQPTVSRMYARWRRLGIVREIDGRVVHLSRPTDLGLDCPKD